MIVVDADVDVIDVVVDNLYNDLLIDIDYNYYIVDNYHVNKNYNDYNEFVDFHLLVIDSEIDLNKVDIVEQNQNYINYFQIVVVYQMENNILLDCFPFVLDSVSLRHHDILVFVDQHMNHLIVVLMYILVVYIVSF